MIFHSHHFHKKGCALGLIFHLRLLPEFLEFSVEWFAFRKFKRFRNFWKLYYLLLFPNFRTFWSNGKRSLSPISIQGRSLDPDVDGFFSLRSNHLGSTVSILVFSRSIMCPGQPMLMWWYTWYVVVLGVLCSEELAFKDLSVSPAYKQDFSWGRLLISFQFCPSFEFKFLLIIQISPDRWIYMPKSESCRA